MSNNSKNILEANVVNKGNDVQFLLYVHTLLELLGEDVKNDTMYRLRNIISSTDISARTKLNYKNNLPEDMMDKVEQMMRASGGATHVR